MVWRLNYIGGQGIVSHCIDPCIDKYHNSLENIPHCTLLWQKRAYTAHIYLAKRCILDMRLLYCGFCGTGLLIKFSLMISLSAAKSLVDYLWILSSIQWTLIQHIAWKWSFFCTFSPAFTLLKLATHLLGQMLSVSILSLSRYHVCIVRNTIYWW